MQSAAANEVVRRLSISGFWAARSLLGWTADFQPPVHSWVRPPIFGRPCPNIPLLNLVSSPMFDDGRLIGISSKLEAALACPCLSQSLNIAPWSRCRKVWRTTTIYFRILEHSIPSFGFASRFIDHRCWVFVRRSLHASWARSWD
jgi:hypothetical protein